MAENGGSDGCVHSQTLQADHQVAALTARQRRIACQSPGTDFGKQFEGHGGVFPGRPGNGSTNWERRIMTSSTHAAGSRSQRFNAIARCDRGSTLVMWRSGLWVLLWLCPDEGLE